MNKKEAFAKQQEERLAKEEVERQEAEAKKENKENKENKKRGIKNAY